MVIDARLIEAIRLIWEVTHDTFFDREARTGYIRILLKILQLIKAPQGVSSTLTLPSSSEKTIEARAVESEIGDRPIPEIPESSTLMEEAAPYPKPRATIQASDGRRKAQSHNDNNGAA